VGLLETTYIIGVAMVMHVKALFSSYSLFDKLIAYVKHEDGNLATLA